MKKAKNKEIEKNLKWFKKFSLLERLIIAFEQRKSIQLLRRLKIEGIRKPA